MIPGTAGPHLIHAEPHMNQEHEDNRHPVIKLGKYRRQSVEISIHFQISPVMASGHFLPDSNIFFLKYGHKKSDLSTLSI
jgi:hypothetical protein